MDDIKQLGPPAATRELSLSDLAMHTVKLTAELERHTNARSYLWGIATGNTALPILTLSAYPLDAQGDDPTHKASIDMNGLSQDVIEGVLYAAISHEEQRAIAAWQEISVNTGLALQLIEKLRMAREKDVQKSLQTVPNAAMPDTGEEEYPATIAMTPPEASPSDVPRNWPGR